MLQKFYYNNNSTYKFVTTSIDYKFLYIEYKCHLDIIYRIEIFLDLSIIQKSQN